VNLLVTFLYDLGSNYALHRQIHALCVKSYRRNLWGVDEVVTLEGCTPNPYSVHPRLSGKAAAYGEMLRDVFARVEALWYKGHSVLLVDADTACVRPTPWPEGSSLRLFNEGNCWVPYGAFPREQYRHAGVRYLPASMAEDLWDVAALLIERWADDIWAYDQYVWNAMYWAQAGLVPGWTPEPLDPRYCYVPLPDYGNLLLSQGDAYIMHYGETRGLAACLRKMQQVVG